MIGGGNMWITKEQRDEVAAFKEPRTRKELISLLGFLGYLRNFIPNFSLNLKFLYKLLRKEKIFAF